MNFPGPGKSKADKIGQDPIRNIFSFLDMEARLTLATASKRMYNAEYFDAKYYGDMLLESKNQGMELRTIFFDRPERRRQDRLYGDRAWTNMLSTAGVPVVRTELLRRQALVTGNRVSVLARTLSAVMSLHLPRNGATVLVLFGNSWIDSTEFPNLWVHYPMFWRWKINVRLFNELGAPLSTEKEWTCKAKVKAVLTFLNENARNRDMLKYMPWFLTEPDFAQAVLEDSFMSSSDDLLLRCRYLETGPGFPTNKTSRTVAYLCLSKLDHMLVTPRDAGPRQVDFFPETPVNINDFQQYHKYWDMVFSRAGLDMESPSHVYQPLPE